jgi:all-trans-retinol 13,14-reductase
MKTDYLIVGSGLSALVFAALMAKSGKKVQVLEAHEHPGGFGHTFTMAKKYQFNAQLHYVWNCGEGQPVNQVLKKLNLDQKVTFERYDPDGFDHMRMPGYSLQIPSNSEKLIQRLSDLFPQNIKQIRNFILEVNKTSEGLERLARPIIFSQLIRNLGSVFCALKYLHSTLQDVFDQFQLPLEAQTLLALQWPDFLLPPNQLSFYAWVILFTGYQKGAFYPTKHFESVINSLVKVIEENDGEVLLNHEVTSFILRDKAVMGVKAKNSRSQQTKEFIGNKIICNIDPKKAAKMIGLDNFSKTIRQKLDYDYSPSNFMAYCVVQDIDLRDYGFGKWNTFHSGHRDLNEAFEQMYVKNDFSNPSFAITTPTLLTQEYPDCPEGCQIIEFLTVANYPTFSRLFKTKNNIAEKRNQGTAKSNSVYA